MAHKTSKEISIIIDSLRKRAGISKYRLSKETDINESVLGKNLKGLGNWMPEQLLAIAKYFRISVDSLMGIEVKKENIYSLPQADNEVKIFERIAAGPETEIFENPLEIINLTHPAINNLKGEIVGFFVKGDSMRPRITEGDIVITKQLNLPSEKPRNKDMIVTVFHRQASSSEGNIKLFNWQDKDKGNFALTSINPYISPQFHNLKEVRYMFRVYLVISKVDYK